MDDSLYTQACLHVHYLAFFVHIIESAEILDLDIGYGQGHLFGEPRAIRDAVLAEAEPPQDFIRGALRRRAVGW